MERMTDEQVMTHLRSDTPLNRARAAFSSECGRIEQAGQQHEPPGPIEIRRMELEAVERILAAFRGRPDLPDLFAFSEAYGEHTVATRDGNYFVFDDEGVRHGVAWHTPEQARRLIDLRNGRIDIAEFGRLEAEEDAKV